jgi:glycosyltransferase involved in cell wall biosynthesis
MKTPPRKVAVGMPVYNARPYLSAAIQSILEQTYSDIELIISDNASTDGSYEICREFAARDTRITLIRQPENLGAPRNFNVVAQLARGPYFKWAAANDLVHPDFIRSCKQVLDERPDCVLCYPRTKVFRESLGDAVDYDDGLDLQMQSSYERFHAVLRNMRLNNVMNGLVRWDALARIGFMPEFLGGDSYMVAELGLAGKIVEVSPPMFFRRMSPDAATSLRPLEERYRHLYPEPGARRRFQQWRQCAYLTRAVFRNRLPISERARVLALTLRMWNWQRRELLKDLFQAVHDPPSRISSSRGSDS